MTVSNCTIIPNSTAPCIDPYTCAPALSSGRFMNKVATKELNTLRAELERLQNRIHELEQAESNLAAALKQLSDKEAFNNALFEYNPILTVVVDNDGRVVKVNAAKRNSGDRCPNIGDIMYKDYAAKHKIDMYNELLNCIKTGRSKRFPDLRYGSKVLDVSISPFPSGAIITSQDITIQKQTETDCINLISDLRRALDEVETLRGLLPICACCKKIRDDKGYWNHIELYISKRTQADFTHTMCPTCVDKLYPDYYKLKNKQSEEHISQVATPLAPSTLS